MSSLNKGASLQNGKYIINSTLGQGGFGITYEAEQVSLRRKVAVKEFFMKDICNRDEATSRISVPSVGSKELVSKFKDKFIREARMIAGLDHEHIVKIHDVFEENGTAYYVMEYLGGGSLGDGVKAGKAMSEQEAVNSIRQIASALSYLHKKGIIHFDVKPSNVLKTEDGKLKLIDFGISKHYDDAGVQTSSTPVGISKGYAPLEQYKQGSDLKSFTPATDIYALGATLYALLTGTNPPEASDVSEDGLPIIAGVSPAVMHTIEKAMQPRRKDRPQSVEEFLRLLDSPVGDDDEETVIPGFTPVPDPKPKPEPQPSPLSNHKPKPSKKSFPKWLYGVFAGIVVAILAVVLINRPDNPSATDNLLSDSTAVVAEVVPEEPVTSKPSTSASKPESPVKPETSTVIELKSISLSKTTLELEEGSNAILTVKYSPNNATDKSTTWKSSDASIAKVSTSGKVTAIKTGSAAIIASCGGKDAYCNVTIKAKEVQQPAPAVLSSASTASSSSAVSNSTSSGTGTHNGHEWVDLGLSVKWATCNVGASSPSDYGSYFAWGETSPKSEYTWATLKYCNDTTGDSFSKYNQNQDGTKDNKTVLDLSDDAARANWGGSWRMPTIAEFQELIDKCTWTLTTVNGKKGYKVVSKSNGNSIFLPAAGWHGGTSLVDAGGNGNYWSGSLDESNSDNARYLFFFSVGHSTFSCYRYGGQSVRPVFR